MGAVTHDNVDDVFTYHPPKGDFQIEKYHTLRNAAKAAAKVVLDSPDFETRKVAIEKFAAVIERNTGDCRDQQEAMGQLQAGLAFAKAGQQLAGKVNRVAAALAGARFVEGPDDSDVDESTQAVISAIRAALMWANASIALEARI